MKILLKNRFQSHFVFLLAALPFCTMAEETSASSAYSGLRYYYPPFKVEPRVIEADVCVYGGTSGESDFEGVSTRRSW